MSKSSMTKKTLYAWIVLPDGNKIYAEGDQQYIDAHKKHFKATKTQLLAGRPEIKRPAYAPPAQPDYAIARQEAYPSVSDQLDMFWKYVADPDHPEVKAMAAKIAAIKASIPKI